VKAMQNHFEHHQALDYTGLLCRRSNWHVQTFFQLANTSGLRGHRYKSSGKRKAPSSKDFSAAE